MCDGSSIILQSKLTIPTISQNHVSRRRLLTELETGINCKLTLISAPAGFGKSSLASEWLQQAKYPFIWLSLSREDNDIAYLVKHIIYSTQKIIKNFGSTALESIHTQTPLGYRSLISILIREFEDFPKDMIIVIDDYHTIWEQTVHDFFSYFISNIPHQLHIYIISRVTPVLPLARLRLSGELNEIGPQDMKFTFKESQQILPFLTKAKLSNNDIRTIHQLTEGWIAGIKMVSLAIKNRKDISDFIDTASGINRDIFDYLEGEVFLQQDEELQDFLVTTSILSELTPSLCNAVSGRPDGADMLDKIEKLNLFLIPLDQNRKWYRYHHFFSDMLYARLQSKHEDKLLQLHHKASIWYLENNFIDEAIFHATASKDYELVASIIAKEGVKPVLQGQFSTLDNWLKTLPEKTILEHPQLSIYKAIVGFFVHASFEQLKSYVALAEQRLIFLSKKNDSTDIDLQDETLRELFG